MLGDIRQYLDAALAAGVDVDQVEWRIVKSQTKKRESEAPDLRQRQRGLPDP